MLTQERLKELLSYDPETGLWTRVVATVGTNVCPAGSVAGHVNRAKGQGYVQLAVDGRTYRSCRLAFLYMTGNLPPAGYEVDHSDRDRINDRWGNLRLATHSQNRANSQVNANNSLGVKGVRRNDRMRSRPFRARIQIEGKQKHIGYFSTAEQAGAAYAAAAALHFGEFSHADAE